MMLTEFKKDLQSLTSTQIFRKYIFDSDCVVLSKDEHLRLKEVISEKYGIEYGDIVVVGSAKLGFSIKPNKRYEKFGDESDIDVALVSKNLFEEIWKQAYLYQKTGAYWPKCGRFFNYLSHGWIRPDKLPESQYFEFADKWWNFFKEITSSGKYGRYKINAGIYYSSFFLTEYQNICIMQCQEEQK